MSLTHLEIYFSPPISDSVSTFPANSLDNTRHSPPTAQLVPPAPPLGRLCLVSDPDVFLPLWPLMVYFVSNLFSVFYFTLGGQKQQFFLLTKNNFHSYHWAPFFFLCCPEVFTSYWFHLKSANRKHIFLSAIRTYSNPYCGHIMCPFIYLFFQHYFDLEQLQFLIYHFSIKLSLTLRIKQFFIIFIF